MIEFLTCLILGLCNRARGGLAKWPVSATLSRMLWFAVPYTFFSYYWIGYDPKYLFFTFICGWLCWILPRYNLKNDFITTLEGILRGIILSSYLIYLHLYECALITIISFGLQGLCNSLGRLVCLFNPQKTEWDEYTEWGEFFTGISIGAGLILIRVLGV